MLGLWLALASIPVLLVVGFALGKDNEDRTARIWRPFKLATSVVLVGVAVWQWLGPAAGTALASAAGLLALGMTFGCLGDLILAQVIPVPRPRLLFGILAFGVGHVLYILAFIQVAAGVGLRNPVTLVWVWGGYVVAAVVLWRWLVYSPKAPGFLNYAALGYAALIAVMTGVGEGLAVQDGHFWPTAFGGMLFLLSDLLLGNREFRDHRWFLVHDVVWVTYIAGQALIVLTPLYARS